MNTESLKKWITYLRHYGYRCVDNILLYGGKIVGRLVFPFILILSKDNKYKSYYPESELKSKTRIFFEKLWYILKYGEKDKYYYIFGFDRKSKNDFKNYVPWLTFTNARNRKNQKPSKPIYDHYNYVCMLRDKFVFEAFCNRVGIQTPTNIGMISDGFFYSLNKKEFIRIEDIIKIDMNAFLKRNVSHGGGMGNDVMPLRIESGNIYVNDKFIEKDVFKELLGLDSWVVQERITNQHKALSRMHPSSINTIRIATVKVGSLVEVLFSNLRVGVNGRYADNISSGGIFININNGKLEKWGFSFSGFGAKIDRHPNTNIIFEDYEIPFWDEIVESVKKSHRILYGIHSIGWDVCITDEGIMLIEGNDNYDTIDAQLNGCGKELYIKYFKD